MYHIFNIVIPIAVLLPNLIFFVLPPRNLPNVINIKEGWFYKGAEGIGRISVFLLPLFSVIHVKSRIEIIAFIGMTVSLSVYYIVWTRYFLRDREYKLLFSPFFKIPVPLAISPVFYFICASIILHSIILFIGSVLLAIGHIPLSIKTHLKHQNDILIKQETL